MGRSKNYTIDSLSTVAYRDSMFCFTGTIPESCLEVSSVSDNVEDFDVSISPNPSAGLINIELRNQWQAQINFSVFNAQGIRIEQKLITETKSDILISKPPGLYYLQFSYGEASITKRLIIVD